MDSAALRQSTSEVHGDGAASRWLEETFRDNARFVANTLRRFGVAASDIPDQLQEVFLVVHRRRATYDETRPLKAWLFGITYRIAGRYRRARPPSDVADIDRVVLHDPEPLADVRLETKRAQELVLAALGRIELSRRAVFILADLEGEAVPAIAEALDLPLNTTYSRLRLAREEFTRAVARLRGKKEPA